LKAKKLNVYVLREHCNSSLSLGIARGVGWQSIAGYASIGSYYLVGIPVGSILCFVAKLRGRGLWIGILLGCFSQTMVLALVTVFTNWDQEVYLSFSNTYLHHFLIIKVLNFISIGLQATKARDRVLEMTPKGNQETENIKEDAQVLLSDISENV